MLYEQISFNKFYQLVDLTIATFNGSLEDFCKDTNSILYETVDGLGEKKSVAIEFSSGEQVVLSVMKQQPFQVIHIESSVELANSVDRVLDSLGVIEEDVDWRINRDDDFERTVTRIRKNKEGRSAR